ncbi:hypothetical protein LTS18_000286 [Coniosporium uncinatum]|uniref:Uncharacterized protein n=1 Tax=Coniosporium uncinatum TaxID=93489 RepID=A0ACC3D8N7_9PEZI|nr:hypothetical protein LTS18_000286 [Coniosporium uncinatum]
MSFSYSTSTTTSVKTKIATSISTVVQQTTSTKTVSPDMDEKRAVGNTARAPPTCLTRNGNAPTSYPAKLVSSACSCLSASPSAVTVTPTVPTSTSRVVSTTKTTTTNILQTTTTTTSLVITTTTLAIATTTNSACAVTSPVQDSGFEGTPTSAWTVGTGPPNPAATDLNGGAITTDMPHTGAYSLFLRTVYGDSDNYPYGRQQLPPLCFSSSYVLSFYYKWRINRETDERDGSCALIVTLDDTTLFSAPYTDGQYNSTQAFSDWVSVSQGFTYKGDSEDAPVLSFGGDCDDADGIGLELYIDDVSIDAA